MKPFIRRKKRN